jgi:DNA polymerase/3'-5' exonuclease PolX
VLGRLRAGLFDRLGDLLEIEGANSFRIRACLYASRTIASLAENVRNIHRKV